MKVRFRYLPISKTQSVVLIPETAEERRLLDIAIGVTNHLEQFVSRTEDGAIEEVAIQGAPA